MVSSARKLRTLSTGLSCATSGRVSAKPVARARCGAMPRDQVMNLAGGTHGEELPVGREALGLDRQAVGVALGHPVQRRVRIEKRNQTLQRGLTSVLVQCSILFGT